MLSTLDFFIHNFIDLNNADFLSTKPYKVYLVYETGSETN